MIEISSAHLEVPGVGTLQEVSVAQTIPAWGQSVIIDAVSTVSIQIAAAHLELPNTALAALDLRVAQSIPPWSQSVSLFEPVGSINGGGTISDEHPHRSMSAVQTVPAWVQSALIGAEGAAGPASITVTQVVPAWTQTARVGIFSDLRVAQTVPAWAQVAVTFRDRTISVDQQVPAWTQRVELGQVATRLLSAAQTVPPWTNAIQVVPDRDITVAQQVPPWVQSAFARVGDDIDPSVRSQTWIVPRFNRTWKVTT